MTSQPLMPQLRAILDKAEPYALVYAQHEDGARIFIEYLDTIAALESACTAAGLDIDAERVRSVALDGRARADAESIMRALNPAANLTHSTYAPLLAELARSLREARMRRRSIFAGCIAALIIGLTYIIMTAPPSADIPAITTAAVDGDTAGAYALAQHELQQFPDDPELLLWASVLAETLGDSTAAAGYWEHTTATTQNPTGLAYERGNTRLLARNIPAAQTSVAELLGNDKTIPEGLFLQAAIAEAQGNIRDAIAGYEKASTAADAANRQEMVALIRIRMGGLMRFGVEATPTKTP